MVALVRCESVKQVQSARRQLLITCDSYYASSASNARLNQTLAVPILHNSSMARFDHRIIYVSNRLAKQK